MSKIIVDQIQKSGGTAFNVPTTDGSAGQVMKTDGQGGLTFGTVDTLQKAGGALFQVPTADGSAGQFIKTDGAGNLSFGTAGGGLIAPTSSGELVLSTYFPEINWNNTNTNSYGWLIQRTYGVTAGVGQFALIQGGYRPTAAGGCKGTILPFQIDANNAFIAGTPTTMWTNPNSTSDFSTCTIITDNKSGGFHYSGNIPWPGNSSHMIGYGYGLLNANNTASNFWNSGTTNSNGIHFTNGQWFGLPDSDGWGWRGANGGYANSDGTTRIHAINFTDPNSPSISVHNPSANTSTTPTMMFLLQEGSNTSNTAISGAVHWRNGSNYIHARVFSATDGNSSDYTANDNWDNMYSSNTFLGVALSTGAVLVYHGGLTARYTAYNTRTTVTASHLFNNLEFRGATFIPDGVDSWLVLSSPSTQSPVLQKWSINPSTYVWTKNWETTTPLMFTGNSYLKLNKLGTSRLLLSHRDSNGRFAWWTFNRSQFPA